MKIYNQEKTQELNREELDFELGYLQKDKLFVVHHDATPFVKGRTAAEIANEKRAEGFEIIEQDGNFYAVDKTYESGGKSVSKIKEEEDMPAKDAYDDFEDIQVYIPYTEEELKKIADRKRHAELKAELEKIKEDIEQETFGIVRSDFAEKKARAAGIVNELRVLEGKEPREVRA